ncbi:hypothetical protein GQ600_10735 [Phytophthora cactorum]|nr:hypothetical protein GQ600_10735 [Phytophthora cactorum]
MGHPSCRECDEFTALKENAGNNQTYHICNHCNNAYRASRPTAEGVHRTTPLQPPAPEPTRIIGRSENYRSHWKSCRYYLASIQARTTADSAVRSSSSVHSQATGSASMRSRDDDASSTRRPSHEAEGEIFMRLIVKFQADNRLPDSFIERLSTVRLLHRVSKMIADIFPLLSHK